MVATKRAALNAKAQVSESVDLPHVPSSEPNHDAAKKVPGD